MLGWRLQRSKCHFMENLLGFACRVRGVSSRIFKNFWWHYEQRIIGYMIINSKSLIATISCHGDDGQQTKTMMFELNTYSKKKPVCWRKLHWNRQRGILSCSCSWYLVHGLDVLMRIVTQTSLGMRWLVSPTRVHFMICANSDQSVLLSWEHWSLTWSLNMIIRFCLSCSFILSSISLILIWSFFRSLM